MGIRDLGFVAAFCVIAAACGKKGPPLAPLVPIPSAVEVIKAERVGNEVFVSFTIPIDNVDEFTPADIGRVEVYGYTGRATPSRGRWVEFGTLVATVPVAPPPPAPGEVPDPAAVTPDPDTPLQGASVTVRDTLTADELVQGKLPPPDPKALIRKIEPPVEPLEEGLEPVKPKREVVPPLRRFYAAVPWSTRGRNGPPGAAAELSLLPVPAASPSAGAVYDAQSIVVSWEPSGGLIGFLLERALPDEPPPFVTDELEEEPEPEAPRGPVQYNVYREIAPDPLAPPPAEGTRSVWTEGPLMPVNPFPLSTFSFTDGVEFGRRRCYTVRAVRGSGAGVFVGEPSPPACITPIDTFAPAPPASLAAVASEGAVSLIWEPGGDLDLGGYVVLRGEESADPLQPLMLQPLTPAPLTEASYRDVSVKAGVRYVYAVVAVDNRFPIPNMSDESNRVEETAR